MRVGTIKRKIEAGAIRKKYNSKARVKSKFPRQPWTAGPNEASAGQFIMRWQLKYGMGWLESNSKRINVVENLALMP